MIANGLFKKAVNEQGFLKSGFFGFPGSGKTYTASLVAIGLVKKFQYKKPIFAVDSEKGLDYLVDKFDKDGVELQIARTRSFVDLLDCVDEAEKNGSVLIVDSITHVWEEIQEAYKAKNKRKFLTMKDWSILKPTWKQYTEKYLNSKLHIVMCGRAGETFDSFENEEGKLEFVKTGTRMQAEKNLGYEPGLAVEMERVGIGQVKSGQRQFVNRAHILKDRFDVLDGQAFDNPTFETFLPHIEKLNIGIHEGISKSDSGMIFEKGSDSNWAEIRKQTEIYLEEIQNELVSAYPGRSADETKKKTDIVWETFQTRSWAALNDYSPERLKEGLTAIREKLAVKEVAK